MSKIGQAPIQYSAPTTIELRDNVLHIKGAEGELQVSVPRNITVDISEDTILVRRSSEERKVKSLHGLVRMLTYNAIKGVETPWKRTLDIVGTGYKVKQQGRDLVFDIGYSHPVLFKESEGVVYEVEGNQKVHISGIDKQKVGEVAFKMKSIRKPDPYKGKGIRYSGEVIKLKPGKKAKTA